MLRKLRKKIKGQSTVEYAVLIIIIIGALLSIQVYVKRGVQGRLRAAADDIGEQFSPGNTNYLMTVTSSSHTNEVYTTGVQQSTLFDDEITNMVTIANIVNVEQEFWGRD